MQESLFELNGWALIRYETDTSDSFDLDTEGHVYISHLKCSSYGYYTVRDTSKCNLCREDMPDEIVALWCLQEPDLL